MSEIKVKVGGVYKDRDGNKWKIHYYDSSEQHPFVGKQVGWDGVPSFTFREDGQYLYSEQGNYDLVDVVYEPNSGTIEGSTTYTIRVTQTFVVNASNPEEAIDFVEHLFIDENIASGSYNIAALNEEGEIVYE